jgi:hypothetical protein
MRCDYWTAGKGQCENEAMDGWTMCRSHLGFDPDYVDADDDDDDPDDGWIVEVDK